MESTDSLIQYSPACSQMRELSFRKILSLEDYVRYRIEYIEMYLCDTLILLLCTYMTPHHLFHFWVAVYWRKRIHQQSFTVAIASAVLATSFRCTAIYRTSDSKHRLYTCFAVRALVTIKNGQSRTVVKVPCSILPRNSWVLQRATARDPRSLILKLHPSETHLETESLCSYPTCVREYH